MSGAAPRVFELGHVRRARHICTEEQFGPQCAGPTTLHLNIALHPTIREQQVYTSNITFKDKYNPVRVKHQYIYIYLDCYIYITASDRLTRHDNHHGDNGYVPYWLYNICDDGGRLSNVWCYL